MKRLYRVLTMLSFCLCLGAISTGCCQSEAECVESCKKKHKTNSKGGFATAEGANCMMRCKGY